jgi:hypothetical protein
MPKPDTVAISAKARSNVFRPTFVMVVLEGPTHHGSVMFRRGAYVKAGGYRAAFYNAQDWPYPMATGGAISKASITPYQEVQY